MAYRARWAPPRFWKQARWRKSPRDDGDIHRVSNALADRVSISIHVYGGNIGAVKRAVYTPEGQQKPFISGYSNRHLPNIWDSSREHQG